MTLKETLKSKRLVQDGALGTQLELLIPVDSPLSVKGSPLWSTKVLIAEPTYIQKIHESYLEKGADMLVTSSYQASLQTLEKHEHMTLAQAQLVWQKSVEYCQKAVDNVAQKKVYVASSIGPYGAFLANGAEYSGAYDGLRAPELADYHREMVKFFLSNKDVDLIAFETIPNFEEIKGLFKLLDSLYTEDFHKEFYLCLSCKDSATLADGTPLSEVVKFFLHQKSLIVENCFLGTGCNCVNFEIVSGFIDNVNTTCQLENKEPLNLTVYPNLGFDNDMSDVSQYGFKSSTEKWGEAIEKWCSSPNVRVIGSCCSTGPLEVATIRAIVDKYN